MKIKSAEFHQSAPDLRSCPNWQLPEFALIGRSNVGKSSLVNLLTNQKTLAKVSGTPGKTQLLNFFVINNNWSLVDLPGYGYAKVAQTSRADFNQAVARYLSKRDNLAMTFVLIDSRLPPQKIDLAFIEWLNSEGLAYSLIFTKSDKLSPAKVAAGMEVFTQTLAEQGFEAPYEILTSSAQSGKGKNEILGYIGRILNGEVLKAESSDETA